MAGKVAYLFLDECGNFDFSPHGTKYFILTSTLVFRPFPLDNLLMELWFDLIESGLELERFHASEDNQSTRNQVFGIIKTALDSFRVDSVIVEKCKTGPSLRVPERFYPEMMGYLLQYVVGGVDIDQIAEFIIIADRYPDKKKRGAIRGAVKSVLKGVVPDRVQYRVLYQDSKSSYGLQIVDYFSWAIYRRWASNDWRSLCLVSSAVKSQFDIFRRGTIRWY